ncbi:MAG TPA: glycosyltransferase family 4 protein [Isosphaeraceae bacterium]|jgi:UDP-glucose:(heptosyl)LPS alpha-1,3-glucosyltransferase|nr:glycosyltransferase family 4 protein [Isosphaeraceae bacterium]
MRLALNFERVDPSRGGAETYVRDLATRLVQSGHEVSLYANAWVPGALPAAVNCRRIEARGLTRLQRIWSFARNSEAALKGEHHDCTIGFINTWFHDVIIPQGGLHAASLECNARRFPSGWRREVYRLAKRANPKYRLYQAIERRQYDPERPVRVVAVSQMVQGHIERFHGVPREGIQVIPNAIDASRLSVADPLATRAGFRKQHGLRDEDLVALFVGHNFWLKGLKPLLEALCERQRRHSVARPIHLLVCGGGRVEPFHRMVRSLGLEATVRLIGFLPDVRAGFWASDFFVLPTYYDPCSLVVFEALACGLPVITTAYNGAGELITEGREGFVISAPDAREELIASVDRMADDTARRAMSAHAEQLGRAQSFDTHMARLVKLFEEVAGAKATRGPHRTRSAPEPHRAVS